MRKSRLLWLSVSLAAGSIAVACGPDFPLPLTSDRQKVLKEAPWSSFRLEATKLVQAPQDALKAIEAGTERRTSGAPQTLDDIHATGEQQGLTGDQVDTVRRMRAASSGDAAFSVGDGLPADVRLYSAGAVDFRQGDLARAAARFREVLKLPEANTALRSTWASYMLGRINAKNGHSRAARRAFATARRLARRGAPDPLGLAVASYGEEARLSLNKAVSLAQATKAGESAAAASYGRTISTAVRLYGQQAARASDSGINSLRFVAIGLIRDEALLAAAIDQPATQRLLSSYLVPRLDQISDSVETYDTAEDREDLAKHKGLLPKLVRAIERRGLDSVQGADVLAALSYRSGQFNLAAKLANQSHTPLALWVKAKLALVRGNRAMAAQHYAQAVHGLTLPAANNATAPEQIRLKNEQSILALSRGQYLDALRGLYATDYWTEMSFLAERVLSTRELKTFVDTAPELRSPRPPRYEGDTPRQLREVLARRFVREGRMKEAAIYFQSQEMKELVQRYADTLREASNPSLPKMERAQSWYEAALLAREKGMELMGYEGPPDFAEFEGSYAPPYPVNLQDPFVSADERHRLKRHEPRPNVRYHYRYVAVQHAMRAADLLPRRSQAFAAVLCEAASWMRVTPDGDQEMKALYRRYIREGAAWPWAADFARSCPEPDFASAGALDKPLRASIR